VKKHSAERAAKDFICRAQLVAMLFCQLAHADSLRDICNGLACCTGKLVHLGISVAPNKSTLSYANRHRPAKLYEDLFYMALAQFRDEKGLGERKRKFRFKNKLLSLDSTTISLCLAMFPDHGPGRTAHFIQDKTDHVASPLVTGSAEQKGASRPMCCLTTTITCPATFSLARPGTATSKWPMPFRSTPDRSLRWIAATTIIPSSAPGPSGESRESLGLASEHPAKIVEQLAGEVNSALTIRAASLRIDEITAPPYAREVKVSTEPMRIRFAMRFGDDRYEKEAL
jgi:hypothetical protein